MTAADIFTNKKGENKTNHLLPARSIENDKNDSNIEK